MARFKNTQWQVAAAESDRNAAANCQEAALAVLMDIRDELQTLNGVLSCKNFLRIPRDLAAIRRNTNKKRRK